MPAPDDESPSRALLVALGAMLAVALVAGLAVAGVVVGAVRFSGIGASPSAESTSSPPLVIPEPSPTPTGEPTAPAASSPRAPARPRPIALTMAPRQVGAGDRIDLSGTYPRGGDGTELQVQRREGGRWVDFPVSTEVSDGRFATYIQTTRTGRARFRVYDAAEENASNVVVVTVR
jgi:hypothetical protein